MIAADRHICTVLPLYPFQFQQTFLQFHIADPDIILMMFLDHFAAKLFDPDGVHGKYRIARIICHNITVIGNSVHQILIHKSQCLDLLSGLCLDRISISLLQAHHRDLCACIFLLLIHPGKARLRL